MQFRAGDEDPQRTAQIIERVQTGVLEALPVKPLLVLSEKSEEKRK